MTGAWTVLIGAWVVLWIVAVAGRSVDAPPAAALLVERRGHTVTAPADLAEPAG